MRIRPVLCIALVSALALAGCSKKEQAYSVEEVPLTQITADLAAGKTTAVAVTNAYIRRIKAYDGPLHAVIGIAPDALDQAAASDKRRAAGKSLGPLDGVPILIKDNIDAVGMPTTAGSYVLIDNLPAKDAEVTRRLRAAGAVILGKTNLSEWANYRSTWSTSGWSGMGGLTRNAYDTRRTPCGSSSGSGAAGALSLAALTIGTETSGSVTCPASMNGLVGIKPTIALVARTGIIPISHNQDTAGPMTRTVADTAVLLTYMAGTDASDPQTAEADAHKTDYVKGLNKDSLKGARIGVMRFQKGYTPETQAAFEKALEAMKAQGAELVEINDFKFEDLSPYKGNIMETDFKEDLNAYLAKTPPAVKTRNLADLLAFSKAEPRENVLFGHETWEKSVLTTGFEDPDYVKLKEVAQRTRGPEGIDKLLTENNVVALVQPTGEPAGLIDTATHLRNGAGGPSAAGIPAVAGYPHLTVPMGAVSGLPVGISFIGPKWSEQTLLSLGYAYEQATHMRRPPDGKAGQGPL